MKTALTKNPIIWSPSDDRIKSSQMYLFMKNINQSHNLKLNTFKELHEWSTKFKVEFWDAV